MGEKEPVKQGISRDNSEWGLPPKPKRWPTAEEIREAIKNEPREEEPNKECKRSRRWPSGLPLPF